jgi:hypothetical protein
VKKWSGCVRQSPSPAVPNSLEEAGLELFTFYDFPKAMWKLLRTTNTVENLNREFRRRTKTQASFGTEDAALIELYGLVAFGHIQLRKIDGHSNCRHSSPRNGRKSRKSVEWVKRLAGDYAVKAISTRSGPHPR